MNTKFLLFLGCAVVLMAVIRGQEPTPEDRVNAAKKKANNQLQIAEKAKSDAAAAKVIAGGYKEKAAEAQNEEGLAQEFKDAYEKVGPYADTAGNAAVSAEGDYKLVDAEVKKFDDLPDIAAADANKEEIATNAETYATEAETKANATVKAKENAESARNDARKALNNANLMRAEAAQTKAKSAATDANNALKEAQGFQRDVKDILQNVNAAIEAEGCTGENKKTAEESKNKITDADTAITNAITTDVESANKTANDRAVEVTGIVTDMNTKISNNNVTDIAKAKEAGTKVDEAVTAKDTVVGVKDTASQQKDIAANAKTEVYDKCPKIEGPTVTPPGPTSANGSFSVSSDSPFNSTLPGNGSSNSSDRADSYGGEAVTANKWLMLCSTAALLALANFAF